MLTVLAVLAATAAMASAQDPAQGWMAYATGYAPNKGGKLTFMEASWVVPDDPVRGGAFFSPWFGIESADNLNLIQPVNPWTGYEWQAYNEYFQWSPTYNQNSKAISVSAGDVLYGSVTLDESTNTYHVYHSDLNTTQSVTFDIKIQNGPDGKPKTFDHAFIVMEKSQWACDQYPPNNEVTFFDITMKFDGEKVSPKWTTAFVDDHCDCRAQVVDESTIKITWDSTGGGGGSTTTWPELA